MSTPSADTVSPQKKARSRKSKKASVEGASSPTESNHVNEIRAQLKLTPEQLEPAADSSSENKRENEAIKEISKREKKLRKKIVNIEASEEKIKDLSEAEKATTNKINADERRKISEKPIHAAVHRELKDIMDILVKVDAIEEKRIASEKAQLFAAHAEELQKAKEEVRKEAAAQADENLRLLLSFLKNVSVRRSLVGAGQVLDPLESQAFEAALVAVYEGTDKALVACHNLFSGLDEPVKEGAGTWALLKELCTEKKPEAATPKEEAQVEATMERNDVVEPSSDAAEPAAEPEAESITEPVAEPKTEPGAGVASEPAIADGSAEEIIVIEKEAVTDSTENIIIPVEEAETAPPAVTATDEGAANAAAEYPTEPATEASSWPAVENDVPILTEAVLNAQSEPIEEATRTGEEAPRTNGDFRSAGRGRGPRGGGYRGRGGDYRGGDYRGGDYRGGDYRGGDYRGGDYRGDGYRPRGDYRGGYRGDHRGEGRGSYGGGRGDRGGYRVRGEGYSGGRGGGYRGRGAYQQNQQQQAQGV